jgi:hypothetical protein
VIRTDAKRIDLEHETIKKGINYGLKTSKQEEHRKTLNLKRYT